MKKLIFIIFTFSTFIFSGEFENGSILVRDTRNIYILDRNGSEIGKISDSGPILWHKSLGVIIAKIHNDKLILKVYKQPENFEEIETDIEVKEVNKLLSKEKNLVVVYTDKNDILKLAIFSEDLKPKDNFPLRDNSGNPVVIKKEKTIIHDVIIFNNCLVISGHPYHSGGISFFNLKIEKNLPNELKGLFSEEEIEKEEKKKQGKIIKTFSGIAGNNRGIDMYDNENLISVCTNTGRITIFSPETGKSKVLNNSVDITGEKWGFSCILCTDDEILVSNSHPKVKKIYLVDKQTGEVKSIFKEGLLATEMLEIK